jgi:hypothetical protein
VDGRKTQSGLCKEENKILVPVWNQTPIPLSSSRQPKNYESQYIVKRMCVTIGGVLDWILDLLTTYPRLGTVSKYSRIAELHTLQITAAHAKYFPPALSSPAVPS